MEKIPGPKKVAIVLLSIGQSNAAKIMEKMTNDEIKEVSYHMATLGTLDPDLAKKILDDFNETLAYRSNIYGDLNSTKNLLSNFLDDDSVKSILDNIKHPKAESNVWDKLSGVNEEILALYLREEHPQTASLIISKLHSNYAAKILSHLPEEFATDLIIRMLNITSVKKDILNNVASILRSEFISSFGKGTLQQNTYAHVAEIFNNMETQTETKYMNILENTNPQEAEKIKELMFTFEDLLKLDEKNIQVLLKNIDKSKLIIALKNVSNDLKNLFIKSMSVRAGKIISEELASLGPVKRKDVDNVQSIILETAKNLISDGQIEILSGSEEYI